MKQLQVEHKEWIAKKYPDQLPKVPALGCVEEAGELIHALLKMQQVATWGEDTRHKVPGLRAKLVDALGDCGIYACSLCNANNWDFEEVWRGSAYTDFPAIDAALYLMIAAVHVAQNPTNKFALCAYCMNLKKVSHSLGLDLYTTIRITWETVKCR